MFYTQNPEKTFCICLLLYSSIIGTQYALQRFDKYLFLTINKNYNKWLYNVA